MVTITGNSHDLNFKCDVMRVKQDRIKLRSEKPGRRTSG
jgi:hypothetical protein